MRDLILLPEILPSVAVGDNTKMCLTSLILFVAAQKIIERMGNPLLKIRFARQRREIDPSGLGPKVPRLVLCDFLFACRLLVLEGPKLMR